MVTPSPWNDAMSSRMLTDSEPLTVSEAYSSPTTLRRRSSLRPAFLTLGLSVAGSNQPSSFEFARFRGGAQRYCALEQKIAGTPVPDADTSPYGRAWRRVPAHDSPYSFSFAVIRIQELIEVQTRAAARVCCGDSALQSEMASRCRRHIARSASCTPPHHVMQLSSKRATLQPSVSVMHLT